MAGFSLLSGVSTTYNGFFFVTLKPWKKRTVVEEQLRAVMAHAIRHWREFRKASPLFFRRQRFPNWSFRRGDLRFGGSRWARCELSKSTD
jgi:hydrophobic/amphiphilic exporter-1 (mainly G- bacteria), HAE1 family